MLLKVLLIFLMVNLNGSLSSTRHSGGFLVDIDKSASVHINSSNANETQRLQVRHLVDLDHLGDVDGVLSTLLIEEDMLDEAKEDGVLQGPDEKENKDKRNKNQSESVSNPSQRQRVQYDEDVLIERNDIVDLNTQNISNLNRNDSTNSSNKNFAEKIDSFFNNESIHGHSLNSKQDHIVNLGNKLEDKAALLNAFKEDILSEPKEDKPELFYRNKNIKEECILKPEISKEIEKYRPTVEYIIKNIVYGEYRGKTYNLLAELVDNFGSRMTCSDRLKRSIDWIVNRSKEMGMTKIYNEDFYAPHWVRNNESLVLLQPRLQELKILGLGSSIGTPPRGITAEIVVVRSFEELKQIGSKVAGKIVAYNPPWTTYGEMVKYRGKGASMAAKLGAKATLVKSVTPFSMNTPHTGWQSYDKNAPKIPTACITQEDVEMFQRMQDRGEKIHVNLYMGAQNYPDCLERNTILELEGASRPNERVVVSGHLDSWDVGVGAMDDGGGCVISWMVPLVLNGLNLKPKRTIQTVLFAGEEQGLHGGEAYFGKHSHEKNNYQLLLESDVGTFNALGLSFSGNHEALCIVAKIASLMDSINATTVTSPMSGGPDITFWKNIGIPTGSLLNANEKYFWFHHSEGDRLEIEDSDVLDKCAALWTAVAYVAADMDVSIPR